MRLNRKRLVRFLLLGTGVSVAGLLACFLALYFILPRLFDPVHFTQEVRGTAEVLYVKGVAWGITGDHQIWWITTHGDSEEPDSVTDYVFRGLDPFFYEVSADTLILYTRRAAEMPPSFESDMAVRQVELSNTQMMGLYARRDSLGLGLAR